MYLITVYFFMVFPAYAGSDPLITIHLHVFCLMLPRFLLAKCFTAPEGTFWSLAVAGATNCCLLFLELASYNPKRALFKHDEPLHHMINKWWDLHMTSWGHIRSLLTTRWVFRFYFGILNFIKCSIVIHLFFFWIWIVSDCKYMSPLLVVR